MSTPLLRMPKGVPREIARVLSRTSTRRIPKPGQVLSYENATVLYDLLEQYRRTLAPAVTKAARGIGRARTAPTRQKYANALEVARARAGAVDAALHDLARGEAIEPLPPLAGKRVVPVADKPEPSREYVRPVDTAVEWEIGVDYTEAEGYDHPKGRASDVSFNARIFRRDRKPMTEEQVRDIVNEFANDGTLPRGVVVEGVSWQNWKGYTRRGTADDLENFRAILLHVGDAGLRLGAVKGDRL